MPCKRRCPKKLREETPDGFTRGDVRKICGFAIADAEALIKRLEKEGIIELDRMNYKYIWLSNQP